MNRPIPNSSRPERVKGNDAQALLFYKGGAGHRLASRLRRLFGIQRSGKIWIMSLDGKLSELFP